MGHDDSKKPEPEMRAEYRFDYSKSRPNRFAKRMAEGRTVEERREA